MANTLKELRKQIDDIDTLILDLLSKRSDIISKVAIYKKGLPVKIRPAREIQMNWHLAGHASEAYPAPVLQRIWREIITSTLTLEGGFSVSVFFDETHDLHTSMALWDLTRDHFGTWCPIYRHTDKIAMIEALAQYEVELVVLPLKNQSIDPKPWWLYLANRPQKADWNPRVSFHLPFSGPSNSHAYVDIEALALSCAQPEASGYDESIYCLEVALEDYADFIKILETGNYKILEKAEIGKHDFSAALIQLDGYLEEDHPQIMALKEKLKAYQPKVTWLGSIGKTPPYK